MKKISNFARCFLEQRQGAKNKDEHRKENVFIQKSPYSLFKKVLILYS